MSVTNPYNGRNLRDLKQTITSVYLKRKEKSGAIKSVQLPCSKKLGRGMCAVDVTAEAATERNKVADENLADSFHVPTRLSLDDNAGVWYKKLLHLVLSYKR